MISAAWKKKLSAGNCAASVAPKLPCIVERRVMIRLQRNQYVTVAVAVGDGVAEGQVNAGIRQSDIVEDRIDFLRPESRGESRSRWMKR